MSDTMIKKKIIFATGNEGKLQEIRMILADLNVEVISMKEAGITHEIEENGASFSENAVIKATTIMKETGILTLADDSGLEIDYLNKEPGIYSARYLGENTPYSEKKRIIIERLQGVPDEQRTARFVCAIAAALPNGDVLTTTASVEGRIGYEEEGANGFGYDPIFYLPEYKCTSAQLAPEKKNEISHRGKALECMKKELMQRGVLNEMKILIVSDTHRQNSRLYQLIDRVKPVDAILHCGDIEGEEIGVSTAAKAPVIVVSGNNDFTYGYDMEKCLNIGKYRVYMTHGHQYGVHYGIDKLKRTMGARGANIIIYGHTHVPEIKYELRQVFLNPGSLTYPRQEERKPSYIMMDIDKKGVAHFTIQYLES